jgi:hypothetical protein
MRRLILVGALAAAGSACQTTNRSGAAVKVTNGQETTDFPAVVAIQAGPNEGCTATFINDSMALTAAHCVVDFHNGNHQFPKSDAGFTPDAVFVDDRFFPFLQGNGVLPGGDAFDIAVVVFGDGAAAASGVTSFPSIARTFPGVGQTVTVVGFGLTDFNDNNSADGKKHFGQTVIQTAGNGSITTTGPCGPTSQTNISGVAPGDSGGPLLFNGEIIAVVSNGACINGTLLDKFTATTHATAQALLAKALASQQGKSQNPPPGGSGQLCGNATQNTQVCIDASRTVVSITSVQSGQTASYDASPSPSQSLPGATSFSGVANLGFVAGMSASTQVAFVVDESNGQARLFFNLGSGFLPWPGSGTFSVQ